MARGSLAVLTRPSVATFEAHERPHFGWATLYVALGSLLTGLIALLGYYVKAPYVRQRLEELRGQVADLEHLPIDLADLAGQPTLLNAVVESVATTLLGFALFVVGVYLLGRAVGGAGRPAELAYDVALYWTPIGVLQALLAAVTVGPAAPAALIAQSALALYHLYLTYLGVRAGMDLSGRRAAAVMALFAFLGGLLTVIVAAAIVALLGAALGGTL
jgi:hypothetical protein